MAKKLYKISWIVDDRLGTATHTNTTKFSPYG